MSPGNTDIKQGKFVEFISPAKGYFREMYKSQNINPIFPTPKFTLGIIQIIFQVQVLSSIKNKLISTISTFQPDPEVRGVCVKSKFLLLPFYLLTQSTISLRVRVKTE